MPRPFTGGSSFTMCASPLPEPLVDGAGGSELPARVRVRLGCRRGRLLGAWPAGTRGDAETLDRGLRPGRFSRGGLGLHRFGGSPGLGRGGLGSGVAGAAAFFLAPGRRAPAAMPRPLTSGSGLAGAWELRPRRELRRCRGSGGRRRRRSLLGAGTFGAPGDPEALDLGLGLGRARREPAACVGAASAAGVPPPSWRRDAWRRRRCRDPSGRPQVRRPWACRLGRVRCGLLGAGALGGAGDAEAGDGLGLGWRCGRRLCSLRRGGAASVRPRRRGSSRRWWPRRERRAPRIPLPPCPFRAARRCSGRANPAAAARRRALRPSPRLWSRRRRRRRR